MRLLAAVIAPTGVTDAHTSSRLATMPTATWTWMNQVATRSLRTTSATALAAA